MTAKANVAARLLLAALIVSSAQADTLIWTNTGGSSWTSGANWSTGNPPGSHDDAQFGADPKGKSAVGISMSSASLNNGGNNEAVGAVEQTLARTSNLIITNSSSSAVGVFTLNGTTVNNVTNVILRNASSANLTLADGSSKTMGIVLGNSIENIVSLDGSGNLTISAVISNGRGTTPLTFAGSGSGATAITGTNNTFKGSIQVTGAEVDFSGDGSLGNAANNLTVNGGRLGIAKATAVTISSSRRIFLGTNSTGVNTGSSLSAPGAAGILTYNGVLADIPDLTGALVKQGAGTLALGGVSTFSGNVSINNGTVQLTTGNNRLPIDTTVYFGESSSGNLGTFDLNGNSQQISGLNSTLGINSNVFAKNTVTNSSATTVSTLTLTGSGTYTYGDGSINNSGIITGSINLIWAGSGSQSLGDTNSAFSGALAVQQGTLAVPIVNDDSINGPLGNSTNPVTLGSGGGTGTLEYTGSAASSTKRFILAAKGTGCFQIDTSGATLTVSGVISGSNGSLQKSGPGTLVLNNVEEYSGNTAITGGTLALGRAGSIAVSKNIILGAGAAFDVSALDGFVLGSSQMLSNNDSTAVLNGKITTGFGTVSLTYAAGTPVFTVTNGTLTLSAETTFEINNTGTALALGSYKLISTNVNGSGFISGSTLPSVAVSGSGVAAGATCLLQLIAGELYLVVSSTINTTPPVLTNNVKNGSLKLAWPSDHTGWRLLVQTNNLAKGISLNTNDWAAVPGSSTTNQVSIPLNATNPAEFYRLLYP